MNIYVTLANKIKYVKERSIRATELIIKLTRFVLRILACCRTEYKKAKVQKRQERKLKMERKVRQEETHKIEKYIKKFQNDEVKVNDDDADH